MEINYDYLRRLRQDEQSSMALIKLPDRFYEAVRSYVKEVKNRVGVNPNFDNMREYENLVKTLNDITRLRLNKIVLRSLHHQEEVEGLTKEEKELFADINQLVSNYESSMDFTAGKRADVARTVEYPKFEGSEFERSENKEPEKPKEALINKTSFSGIKGDKDSSKELELEEGKILKSIREDFITVKIKQNIPAYSGIDGNVYGPFETGQRVKLPKEEAEFLLNANMADNV